MILEWHDRAEEEFVETAAYYERCAEGLGDRFIDNAETALRTLLADPLMPSPFPPECRKLRIKKFPYALVYRVEDDVLQVIAVMHLARRPGYWTNRFKD